MRKNQKHNCRIWGSENPHVIHEHERDTPKANVWCRLTRNSVIGPFFFIEVTVTGHVYLDMLQNFFIDQLPPGCFSSKMGHRPINIDSCVTSWMQIFSISGLEEEDPLPGLLGHPIWPLMIFFWGFVKNVVYQGDRPTTLEELRGRITNAAALVTPQMLQNTWREVEHRLDVCRATQGAHIELHWPSSETRWVFISSYVKVYDKIHYLHLKLSLTSRSSSVDTLYINDFLCSFMPHINEHV